MKYEPERERDLATTRLASHQGVYNVSPLPYVFGISIGLIATLVAAYAATSKSREDSAATTSSSAQSGAAPEPTERLIWVQ